MCYSYHEIGEIQRAYTKLRRNYSQTFFKISVFKKNLTKNICGGVPFSRASFLNKREVYKDFWKWNFSEHLLHRARQEDCFWKPKLLLTNCSFDLNNDLNARFELHQTSYQSCFWPLKDTIWTRWSLLGTWHH